MFPDVPGCSGMFRVPGFIDALSYLWRGAFEERSCLSGPPPKLIIMRRLDFHCRVVFTCVRA